MQILRRHARALLLGGTSLTPAQRLGYLLGGIQWFGDLLGVAFALVVMAALLDLAFGGGFAVGRLAGLLVVAVPALVLLGVLRAVGGVRAASRTAPEHAASVRDAVGAYLVWASLALVVTQASVRGLVEPAGVFLRTPKVSERVRWSDALRANRVESLLVLLAVLALLRGPGAGSLALTLLLVLPVLGWIAAPVHTISAMRADLPAGLRARRTRERRRGWWRRGPASVPALLAAALGAVLLVLVVQPGSVQQPTTPALPAPSGAPRPGPSDGATPTPDAPRPRNPPPAAPIRPTVVTTSAPSTSAPVTPTRRRRPRPGRQ
ncbi:hypothetical protein ASG78_11560 [Nostocoides sp. Soil756]|jgi:hypothetical protein|nr:hypothetical protein ASG78_11560 [Tetrasphaera sp. Soil756]